MKILLITFLIFNFSSLSSQNYNSNSLNVENISLQETNNLKGEYLSQAQRVHIEKQIRINRQKLQKKGILNPTKNSKALLFEFPLKTKEGFNDPGYYTISSYMDHDNDFPNYLQDYNCGEITYDTEDGYNHQGTDFLLWPFPWYKMDNDQVEVVAVAPGIIIYKQDGNFDRNCDEEDLPWNVIILQHSNGYITWYGHMKNGSLTEKNGGEEVEVGEYLGVVGSSGISRKPHLHLEVYDDGGDLVDPYFGSCNPTVNESLWIDQKPYLDAGINKITTNSTLAVIPDCSQQEILNESSEFSGNDTVFLLIYFRNLSTGDNVNITITRPDNSIHSQWVWESEFPFYVASWNYWFLILKNEQDGLWKFEANYKNENYKHEFQYTKTASIDENEVARLVIFPNPVSEKVIISIPEILSKDFKIRLTNIMGQKVDIFPEINENRKSIILNCKNLTFGTYIVSIEANKRHYRGQFIKR